VATTSGVDAAVAGLVVDGPASEPRLASLPSPVPADTEVVVEVSAAPLNPVDITVAAGRFPGFTPSYPYVPGSEGVGRVVAGSGPLSGRRVWWMAPASLAERVAVPVDLAVPVLDDVDDVTAAALGIPALAAWLALVDVARLRRGERVLVLGATGAVGRSAVQIARALGARWIAAAGRSFAGLSQLQGIADVTIRVDGAESIADVVGPAGVDVVIDPLSGEASTRALAAAAPGARHVVLGTAAGAALDVPAGLLIGKGVQIAGQGLGSVPAQRRAEGYAGVLEMARAGALDLPVRQMAPADAGAAWRDQRASPGARLVVRFP